MIFVGEKVVIVPLEKADLPTVWKFREHEPILGFFETHHNFHKEGEKLNVDPYALYLNWTLNQMYGSPNWYWGIYQQSPVKLIGAIWTTEVDDKCAWPTVLMDKEVWGKGYIEDAAEAILGAFLGPSEIEGKPEGGYSRMMVFCHRGNQRAQAYAKGLGFKETGYIPDGNERMDKMILSLTREDWFNRNSKPEEQPAKPKRKRGRPRKKKPEKVEVE